MILSQYNECQILAATGFITGVRSGNLCGEKQCARKDRPNKASVGDVA